MVKMLDKTTDEEIKLTYRVSTKWDFGLVKIKQKKYIFVMTFFLYLLKMIYQSSSLSVF